MNLFQSRCEFQLHVNGFKVVDPPSSETWNCDFMPVLECESIRRKLVDLWMQQEDKGSLTESLVEEMIIPSDAQEALDQVPGKYFIYFLLFYYSKMYLF